MSDYTTRVTHLRIHDEGDGWALDGGAEAGKYTEKVWKYDTLEDALKAAPEFAEALAEDGIAVPETDGTISVVIHRTESVRVSSRPE